MPQLRIGFLARDWAQIEPWVHRLVTQTLASEGFVVSALIESLKHRPATKVNWLYALLYPLEKRVLARPIAADMDAVTTLLSKKAALSSSNIDAISSLNLDVIISVDPKMVCQEYVGLAHHGVWFLDMFDHAEGLTAFNAVCGKDAVAQIGLGRFGTNATDRQLLASATINPKILLSRTALFMKEKAIVLILRELQRLAHTGEIANAVPMGNPQKPSVGIDDMMGYLWNIARKFSGRGFAAIKRRTGVRPDKFILLTGTGDVLDFDPISATKIEPPGNNFWADPFLWKRDGKMYCFYEHYSRSTKTGIIQVGEFQGDQLIVLGDALKTDIHLSFPYLFEQGGELYMMPETCAAKRIEIWRCTDFPLNWELHSTAMDGQNVADSMILRRDGKWWLFTNIANDIYSDNCSELHIFEIDGPSLKNLTPHLANPVVMDSRTARNAGRFHEIEGRIYRPSQDNAFGQYGFGLNIMEVEELSLETYKEKLVRRIDPKFDRCIVGCHHFDARGNRFVIDALKTN